MIFKKNQKNGYPSVSISSNVCQPQEGSKIESHSLKTERKKIQKDGYHENSFSSNECQPKQLNQKLKKNSSKNY